MAIKRGPTLPAKGAYRIVGHIQIPGGRFYGLPVPPSIRRPFDPPIVTDLDEAAKHRERISRSQKHRGVT